MLPLRSSWCCVLLQATLSPVNHGSHISLPHRHHAPFPQNATHTLVLKLLFCLLHPTDSMPRPCRSRCKCTCKPEKPMLPIGEAWMLLPTLHQQLLIWTPQLAFWLFLTKLKDGYPDLFSGCSWDEPGQMRLSSSQCWL
jgi:hypothetical protein